jgi:hypothetical protein
VPPLTDAEAIQLEKDATRFWNRCAAAGVSSHEEPSWRAMYRADAEDAEACLDAHRRSYTPPAAVTEEQAALASFEIGARDGRPRIINGL